MNNEYDTLSTAVFAGGCFWCMVPPFAKLYGVKNVIAGYTGGHTKNPTYESVSAGNTGHYEAVKVIYDSNKISYQQLLDTFWNQIDPTDLTGQFADKGQQYTTAIFYYDLHQKKLAEESKSKIDNSGKFNKKIVTEILPAQEFYPAEEYHQDFYIKNPEYYNSYKYGSGRQEYLEKIWGGTD